MNSPLGQPLTAEELHAFVDGQLSSAELAALQARLAQDPLAQATVLKWQQQRSALRCLYQDVLTDQIPASLLASTQQAAASQQGGNPWWRWGGIAAGVLMAFGVGWFANSAWNGQWQALSPLVAVAKARAGQDFVRQASFAHAAYSPEVRHPVEVTAAEQEHLVQWLSKRVGKPIKVPHLGALGYELVGGRLLPGEAGARAQFMFQNAAGTRITLYLGAIDKVGGEADTRGTGFNFATEATIPSFYWIDHGFGYALAGPVPRAELMNLAKSVYRQL
jgi:anti-sigma factor RsiW